MAEEVSLAMLDETPEAPLLEVVEATAVAVGVRAVELELKPARSEELEFKFGSDELFTEEVGTA